MPTKQQMPSSVAIAGRNVGVTSTEASPDVHPASDVKELVTFLSDFTMDELREIPVLRSGARLEQNATYLDLRVPNGEPFRASGRERAGEHNWIVPKARVPHQYWNRLLAKRTSVRPG